VENRLDVNPKGLDKEWCSASTLLKLELKDVPKLWDPFFPQTGIAALAGSSDCGKSTFLRSLAIAVALRKTEFVGFTLNVKYGHAYYISTEDDYASLAANMGKQKIVYPELKDCQGLHFLFSSHDTVSKLDAALKVQKADLIVIDTWADAFYGGSINNLNEVRNDLLTYRDLARKHDCLIVILHHLVKRSENTASDKNKLNGSQAIEATMRSVLELKNGSQDSEKHLVILKSNYLSKELKSHTFKLVFDETSLTFSGTGSFLPTTTKIHGKSGTKYDKQFWVDRFTQLRNDNQWSYARCHEKLKELYPMTEIPGETWFKTHCWEDGNNSGL
jgi:RecA-family ATPase